MWKVGQLINGSARIQCLSLSPQLTVVENTKYLTSYVNGFPAGKLQKAWAWAVSGMAWAGSRGGVGWASARRKNEGRPTSLGRRQGADRGLHRATMRCSFQPSCVMPILSHTGWGELSHGIELGSDGQHLCNTNLLNWGMEV